MNYPTIDALLIAVGQELARTGQPVPVSIGLWEEPPHGRAGLFTAVFLNAQGRLEGRLQPGAVLWGPPAGGWDLITPQEDFDGPIPAGADSHL